MYGVGKMKWLDVFKRAVAAGIAIAVGATVYLSCENKVVGAIMFSVGLFSICAFSLNLFTGKIGYIIENKNHPDCFTIWLGNLCGAVLASAAVRVAKPALAENAAAMVEKKLALSLPQVYILGIFCGMLMYIAVDNFKNFSGDFGKCLGILMCVPTFILCGFEHSVADMAYFAFGITSVQQLGSSALFIVNVSIANGIGALLINYLSKPLKIKAKAE